MFGRKRTRSTRQLTLSPLNSVMPLARYHDVRGIDGWTPTAFPAAPYPDHADVLYAVSQRVDGLAAAGAVDAELGHVVDAEIDAWLTGWRARAEHDLIEKHWVIARLEAASREELTRRVADDDAAQARLAEGAAEYALARSAYLAAPTPDSEASLEAGPVFVGGEH